MHARFDAAAWEEGRGSGLPFSILLCSSYTYRSDESWVKAFTGAAGRGKGVAKGIDRLRREMRAGRKEKIAIKQA